MNQQFQEQYTGGYYGVPQAPYGGGGYYGQPIQAPGQGVIFQNQQLAPPQAILDKAEFDMLKSSKTNDLAISEMDCAQARCNHVNPNTGQYDYYIVDHATNKAHCNICGQDWHLCDSNLDISVIEDVVEKTKDIMQTIKLAWTDVPTEYGREIYNVLAILNRIPIYYKKAMECVNRNEAIANNTMRPANSGYGNPYQQGYAGNFSGMNVGVPNMYSQQFNQYAAQPQYAQPMNMGYAAQPQYAQPAATGPNPFNIAADPTYHGGYNNQMQGQPMMPNQYQAQPAHPGASNFNFNNGNMAGVGQANIQAPAQPQQVAQPPEPQQVVTTATAKV